MAIHIPTAPLVDSSRILEPLPDIADGTAQTIAEGAQGSDRRLGVDATATPGLRYTVRSV